MMDVIREDRLPWMLVGAGGHARSVCDVIQRRGDRLLGLVADSSRPTWLPQGCRMLPVEKSARCREPARWLVAIGDPFARQRLTEQLLTDERVLGTIVAESATVARDAQVRPGTMVMEHAHVGPGTAIGVGAIINTGAVVEHDCQVGDFVHIAPRAVLLGTSAVGSRVLVGASAVVLSGLRVERDSTIGALAVVTRSVGAGATVRGVPARAVGESTDG